VSLKETDWEPNCLFQRFVATVTNKVLEDTTTSVLTGHHDETWVGSHHHVVVVVVVVVVENVGIVDVEKSESNSTIDQSG
jgi:hypothetical protein